MFVREDSNTPATITSTNPSCSLSDTKMDATTNLVFTVPALSVGDAFILKFATNLVNSSKVSTSDTTKGCRKNSIWLPR